MSFSHLVNTPIQLLALRVESRVLLVFFSFVALGTMSSPAQTKASPSAQRHTVVDYYMLLPDKYFEANREQRLHWMLDPKRGAIVDLKNGYLFAPGDGAQTDIYVCLFKRSDRSYLIAVNYNDRNGVFESFLDFYSYDGGSLREVTAKVLPMRFDKSLFYELPRYGKTIAVTSKSGRALYKLVWAGNRFRLSSRISQVKNLDPEVNALIKTFSEDVGQNGRAAWQKLQSYPRRALINALLAMQGSMTKDDPRQYSIAFVLCNFDYEYRTNVQIIVSALTNNYADSAAVMLGRLIKKGDKALLRALFAAVPSSDASLAEALSDIFSEELINNPGEFLIQLKDEPKDSRDKTYKLIDAGSLNPQDIKLLRRKLTSLSHTKPISQVAKEVLASNILSTRAPRRRK